jgi:hypothetical protein
LEEKAKKLEGDLSSLMASLEAAEAEETRRYEEDEEEEEEEGEKDDDVRRAERLTYIYRFLHHRKRGSEDGDSY